jgi:hypothetical protein
LQQDQQRSLHNKILIKTFALLEYGMYPFVKK